MSSLELRDLNQQGLSLALSTSNAPPAGTRGAQVSGLSAQRQQQPQQPQQRPSQERARPRTQVTSEQIRQAAQQVLTQPQQARQENGESAWSTIVRERAFGVAVFALIIGIVIMGPTIGQYSTGVWSTAQTFQSWCQGERMANHTLTRKCRLIVDMPLPPPPGLDQVFKDIGRPEAVAVIAPRIPSLPKWRRPTDEERERANAFIHGPVGNGISLAFFGFIVLMLPLEDRNDKWLRFACLLSLFHITRNASFIFALSNVSILMDWASWLRKVGVKGLSWSSLAVLPVLYAMGYMNEKSTATKITISIISALVVGQDYSHNVLPLFQVLGHLCYGN